MSESGSRNVRRMVKRHYSFRLVHKSVFQEDAILADLAFNLRTPVVWYLYRSCIPKLPSKFFSSLVL